MRLSWLLFVALAFAVPAAAGPKRPDDSGKRVCRPDGASIGSHIRRPKICRTAAEWEEEDAAHRGPDITTKPRQPESWERTRPQ
jgi:hypothetical protein